MYYISISIYYIHIHYISIQYDYIYIYIISLSLSLYIYIYLVETYLYIYTASHTSYIIHHKPASTADPHAQYVYILVYILECLDVVAVSTS